MRNNWHAGECCIFCYFGAVSNIFMKESCMEMKRSWTPVEGKPRTRADGEEQVNWSSESGRAAEDEFNDKQPIDVDAIGGVLYVVRSQLYSAVTGAWTCCGTVRGASSSYLIITFCCFLPCRDALRHHPFHARPSNQFFSGQCQYQLTSICGAEAEAKTVVLEAFSMTAQKK